MQSLTRVYIPQLLLVLIVIVFEISAQQSQCRTPDNQIGACVVVDNCPLISQIILNAPKPLPGRVQDYIRQSHCGMIGERHGMCCRDPIVPVQQSSATMDETVTSAGDISRHRNIGLLPSTGCGPISTNKLAGGEKASLGEFPWMARLNYNTPDGQKVQCGGTIINSRYVVTAAHCINALRRGTSLYSVILGEQNTVTDPDCVDGVCNDEKQEILVDKVVVHKQYNNPRWANDIALVRLSQDANFNGDYIKPVCLPITNTLVEQTLRTVIAAGWGTTENQTQSTDLLKARLSVVPINDCRTALRLNQLDDNQLCAKGAGIVDTCKGDSGSPLVFPFKVGNTIRFVQWGIVSFGAGGCGKLAESKPAVYVRVQKYMDWILDNMEA